MFLKMSYILGVEGDRKDSCQGRLHEGDHQECGQVCQGRRGVMDMKGANIKGIISNVPKSAERGRREQGHEGDHQQGAPERPGGGRGEQGHEGRQQGVLGHGLDDHLLRCSFCCFI